MFLLISLITILAILASYLYKKYARTIILSKQFPGPPALPILGNALEFIGLEADQKLMKMWKFIEHYGQGGSIRIWLGPEFNLWIQELKDVEVILGKTVHIDKAKEYEVLTPWMGEGLLISRGQKWFQRRRIITPAFHFKILEEFVETFDRHGNSLINVLKKLSENEKNNLDFYKYLNLVTLDVICESAMGVSLNALNDSDSPYVNAVRTISTVLHKRMFEIIYRFPWIYRFTNLAKQEKNALKILHNFSEGVILNRRSEILNKIQNNNNETTDENGVKRKLAFLDILLQSEVDGKPLSNLDIREEVDTFMFEGHDTTSSAILFFCYCIGTNPQVQKKCFEEIRSVLGDDRNKAITFEDLNNLHYIELCVKETLRLYPSVPLLGRKINHEFDLNGKIIPAGTNVGISPLQLGRNNEVFPDAEKFMPERFDINENVEKKNPYSYIPFSAGPRNCIGQKFAILEIKSIASHILRNYEIEYFGNEPILIAELILKVRDPLMFRIKERVY